MKQYQLFDDLRPEEYQALEKDIVKRGVLVPVEVDQKGRILDGHNRVGIAKKHGLKYKTITRRFETEGEKREHIIKLNLCRRHLEPRQWGQAFKKLLEVRGVKLGRGANQGNFRQELPKVCEEVGVPERTARHRMREDDRYELLKEERPDLAEKVQSGEMKLTEAKRQKKKEEVSENVQRLPKGKYRIIYADPPWQYSSSGAIGENDHYSRHEKHYPPMPLSEICALDIKGLSVNDAVLFLWVTSPLLEDAFKVINAWGFKYKSSFVWNKLKHNFGHYNSVRHEFLLIATRGSCIPDSKKLVPSVAEIERGPHSEKPARFREIIDETYLHGPRIELFARRKVPSNWKTWGNEAAN